jgi:hypothetical protein
MPGAPTHDAARAADRVGLAGAAEQQLGQRARERGRAGACVRGGRRARHAGRGAGCRSWRRTGPRAQLGSDSGSTGLGLGLNRAQTRTQLGSSSGSTGLGLGLNWARTRAQLGSSSGSTGFGLGLRLGSLLSPAKKFITGSF